VTRRVARAWAQLPHLPQALALVWRASGSKTALWIALLVAQGLLPLASVYLTRALVDRLAASLKANGDWDMIRATLPVALAYGATVFLWELLSAGGRWVRTAQAEQVRDHISELIHERSVAVDLAFYESAEFYDRLHRARDESGSRSVALLEGLGSLAQNGITLAAMMAVLLPLGPWLAVALILSTLPAVHVVVRHTLREHRWWQDHTEQDRRSWYLDWLLTGAENAAELRLFGLGDRFRAAYRELRTHLREGRLSLERDRALAESLAAAMAVVVGGAAGLRMLWLASLGSLTLGDLAMSYQAFQLGQGLMRSLLGNVNQIYANVLFLGSLFEFLSLPSRIAEPEIPVSIPVCLQDGIRFESVTFAYPGSDRTALRNFSLELPARQITAVVGANGAGKSTLIKLLCRFYDPNEGRITLDGIDLRSFTVEELRRRITVVFQQPMHYNMTVRENIGLGDLASPLNPRGIEEAAEAAGAAEVIEGLAERYETLLGNWFSGGAELSVGEWQRIAIARALFRAAPIVLLDEPTSAMDSWAEADWLARFRSLAATRTVLIITHRFTTAMRADMIHVMDRGTIVESGLHEDLVRGSGPYAASWVKQMKSGSVQ
jgi:ATP-binding cassette subfamily B protein